MDKIVEYLSSYTSALKFEDMPPEVVHQAKRLWVDTLACALGGYTSEPSKIAREVGKSIQSNQPATILFSGDSTSMDLAAFANGIMLRHLDYMDFMQNASLKDTGHPSETFAAVLSTAEAAGRDGKTLLLGAVIGWEVMARLAEAASIRDRGFCHCTNIAIAAACAASRMLGLTQEQTAHAIGMTATSHVTVAEARFGNVSMWKGCTAPNGCRNAVFAAVLASKGMTGPQQVFEGRGGLIRALTVDGKYDLAPFESRRFRIMQSSFKYYPLGSVAQSIVDCVLAIRPKLSDIADIQQVTIRTFGRSTKQDGTIFNIMADSSDKWLPQNKETADHSTPYCVALAFIYGGIEARHFSDEFLHDPQLVDLMQKVKVELSEECQRVFPEQRLNIVEVVTRSGQRFEERSAYHKGHPKNPMTDQDLEKKFHSMAAGLLTRKKADTILETLWSLEQADDIGKVIRLMRV